MGKMDKVADILEHLKYLGEKPVSLIFRINYEENEELSEGERLIWWASTITTPNQIAMALTVKWFQNWSECHVNRNNTTRAYFDIALVVHSSLAS